MNTRKELKKAFDDLKKELHLFKRQFLTSLRNKVQCMLRQFYRIA